MNNNKSNSFEPISDTNTEVLILGTLPGKKSLELNEYYGYSRNRFWKVIANITDSDLPLSYEEKKDLLLKNRIGVWDVVHSAKREGSLDSNIKNEIPNDLDGFLSKHKKIKIICFNGTKAQKLFDKYFERKPKIKYILLPSTSPANTGSSFDVICEKWSQILNY